MEAQQGNDGAHEKEGGREEKNGPPGILKTYLNLYIRESPELPGGVHGGPQGQ